MNTFSIRETLEFAWRAFKKYPWAHACVALIFIGLGLLSNLDIFILSLLVTVAMFIAKLGYIHISLRSIEGAKPDHDLVNTLMSQKKKFWRLVGGTLIIGISAAAPLIIIGVLAAVFFLPAVAVSIGNPDMIFSTGIGVILPVLIVAGIFFYFMIILRYAFFAFILVDKDLGIKASLKESVSLTKGNRLKYFGFLLLLGVILIPCAISVIGLLFGIPFAILSQAYIYRKLQGTTPTLGTALEVAPEIHPVVEPETAAS